MVHPVVNYILEWHHIDRHAMELHITLQWRHNERDCVSNNRRLRCLLSRLFRRRSKKTSKLRVTGLCEGNSPVTGEFPAQWPVTRSFDVFCDLRLNKRGKCFHLMTPSWPATGLFIRHLVTTSNKENNKASHYGSCVWIPSKSQQCWKHFRFVMSPYIKNLLESYLHRVSKKE